MPSSGTNLTITNPLVLYRSLLATKRIQPDPAQHRLALHLQKLYDRLIDYEPSVEYSNRLKQLRRTVDNSQHGSRIPVGRNVLGRRGIWSSLIAQKEKRDSLALTRVLTSYEAALQLQSPKGLMLHGEVGTGKSMLIDLFADCLPNRKKRRWHFNTFMLETFSRLEQLRKSKASASADADTDEYSLLWLARDLIEKSPIIFLDEFQLPDRVAAKLLSNLMTSFFQLGGVLIATSNRMPEELAKAAGMEFDRPMSKASKFGWTLGMGGTKLRDDGPGQLGEFQQFLEVLRARCEVWEMEGKEDYRRLSGELDANVETLDNVEDLPGSTDTSHFVPPGTSSPLREAPRDTEPRLLTPKYYLTTPPPTAPPSDILAFQTSLNTSLQTLTSIPRSTPIPWTPTTLTVYGRPLTVPAQHAGTALFTFAQLCVAVLGPADYITLASTYHTIALTDVPVMDLLKKSEARRLITLLDAMYEARCRLFVTADAGPDGIFFPAAAGPGRPASADGESGSPQAEDALYAETYAEIHQDLTSPFRPNISTYAAAASASASAASLPHDALEDDPPNRTRRPGSSFTDERSERLADGSRAPDFSHVGGLTGEDERFAVKRAESRLWEMCSGRWWDRHEEARGSASDTGGDASTSWWRPLPLESRHWERSVATSALSSAPPHPTPPLITLPAVGAQTTDPAHDSAGPVQPTTKDRPEGDEAAAPPPKMGETAHLFPHGASPFRTVTDAPPKFMWTHAWGMMTWGKRAGAWGKGVEGLEERRREREVEREAEKEEEEAKTGGEGRAREKGGERGRER